MRGRIVRAWRYPVKSMLGESIESAPVGEMGVEGDRTYAVVDPATGRVLSAKREPALFTCRARLKNGSVDVALPGGAVFDVDDPELESALSELLGRRVVVTGDRGSIPRIEMGEKSSTTSGPASEFRGPQGTFFDSAPIHIVTTSSLTALREMLPVAQIDERRFRPNFLVEVEDADGFVEEGWVGERVSLGEGLRVQIIKPCGRCVMVTHPQDDLPKDKMVLQTVARRNENNLGVLAHVTNPGAIAVGDEVAFG